jgi:hypothetical protein
MLSRALQKANTAVLLDNAQNFEGAMEAYEDACKLLQQVMIRSSQEEDRRKLDAIVSSCRSGRALSKSVLTQAASDIHQPHRGAPPTRSWVLKWHWQVLASSSNERRIPG